MTYFLWLKRCGVWWLDIWGKDQWRVIAVAQFMSDSVPVRVTEGLQGRDVYRVEGKAA